MPDLEAHVGHVIICDRDLQQQARIYCVSCRAPLLAAPEEEEEEDLCDYCEERPKAKGNDLCQSCGEDDDIQNCEKCGSWMSRSSVACAAAIHCDRCSCDCFICSKCEEVFESGDDYAGDDMCTNCLVERDCAYCGGTFQTSEEDYLCETCREREDVHCCENCGDYFSSQEGGMHDPDEGWHCQDCMPEEEEGP